MDVFVGWTCPKKRCEQRHPQSDGPDSTGYKTTRIPKEDMASTEEGSHDGRGCYPGCGPRPEGVEKKDKGKAINVSKVSIDTMITNYVGEKTDFD